MEADLLARQVIGGERVAVSGRQNLEDKGTISLALGDYDPA